METKGLVVQFQFKGSVALTTALSDFLQEEVKDATIEVSRLDHETVEFKITGNPQTILLVGIYTGQFSAPPTTTSHSFSLN